MKCSNCGSEFQGNFCPVCGFRVAEVEQCPVCGFPRSGSESFCPHCGFNYAAYTAVPPAPAPFTPAQPQPVQTQPMQPQPVQTPIARDKRGRPVLPDILRAFDFRFALVSCMSGFIAMLYFFATFLMQMLTYPTANDYLFALAISLAAEVACFLYAMFLGKPEMWRQRSIRRFEKKGNKPYRYPAYWVAVSLAGILIVVVYVVLMVVLYAIIGAVTGMDALSIFIDGLFSMTAHVQIHPLTWVGVVLFFALAVLFFGIEFVRQSKYKKRFQKAYCGKAASAGGKKSAVTYAQVGKALSDYRIAWEQYWLAPRRKKCESRDVALSGVEMTAIVGLRTKILPSVFGVLMAIVMFASMFAPTLFSRNIFRADKLALVEVGMTEEEVEKRFGSPYRGETDDMTSSDLVWKYYDADYMKLLEKNDNFDIGDIQDEEDPEGAFEDSAALETKPFRYVEVTFSVSETEDEYGNFVEETTVQSILYDARRTRQHAGTGKKAVESQQILTAEVVLGTNSVNLVCEIVCEDGSFFKGMPASARLAYDETADEAGKEVEVEWNDPFGTLFTANATVVEA